MLQFITAIKTSGTSQWSNVVKQVDLTGLDVRIYSDKDRDEEWGELKVYFDTNSWDIQEHGLVYTDRAFKDELSNKLEAIGLFGSDIDYSEFGMQGEDYISFDVGEAFIKSWTRLQKAK